MVIRNTEPHSLKVLYHHPGKVHVEGADKTAQLRGALNGQRKNQVPPKKRKNPHPDSTVVRACSWQALYQLEQPATMSSSYPSLSPTK